MTHGEFNEHHIDSELIRGMYLSLKVLYETQNSYRSKEAMKVGNSDKFRVSSNTLEAK